MESGKVKLIQIWVKILKHESCIFLAWSSRYNRHHIYHTWYGTNVLNVHLAHSIDTSARARG